LLAQSETDWEVVVIDDGSRDGTEEIVSRYASLTNGIRYFRRSCNRGPGPARNIGVRISAGRFITFLDSDDELEVDHLAVRKQRLMANASVRALHGGFKVVGDPWVVDRNDLSKKIHLSQCEVGGTFVIEKSVFEQVGGFRDMEYAEDSEFWERLETNGIRSLSVEHPSYIYYRNTVGQLTSSCVACSCR
jgi:glycosyltransferase involved in cell wall biosynthesis